MPTWRGGLPRPSTLTTGLESRRGWLHPRQARRGQWQRWQDPRFPKGLSFTESVTPSAWASMSVTQEDSYITAKPRFLASSTMAKPIAKFAE
jgi:hypothetical protein